MSTTNKKKEEEENGELVFGQRFQDYSSFKDKGINYKTFESDKPKPKAGKGLQPGGSMIRTAKGTLARRGSLSARQAENRERNRKRAQDAAKKRIANKKK